MVMLIQAQGLTKKYSKKVALDNINLTIEKGQLIAYLGTNGAGKSTTINILTGLLAPTGGAISYAKNLKIGIVFQESVLDNNLSVKDNLLLRARMYRQFSQEWLTKLIDLIGLKSFLHQKYGTLSGGQKRRVDIARALISQPDLLFLDEPTTGLDLQTRLAIWNLLEKLQKEQGLTIFLTTHYLEEAENADQMYILENGKVLANGSALKIKEKYVPSKFIVNIQKRSKVYLGWDFEKVKKYLENHQVDDFEYYKGSINDAFINITGKELQ